MKKRIAPGIGANLLGQRYADSNAYATVYVCNLDPRVTEKLLFELFVQAGPVVNAYLPNDGVTNLHQGYAFVEFQSEEDAAYAYEDKRGLGFGANLFIDVNEKLLYDIFSYFGVIVTKPKLSRDPDTGNSQGFGFINYDSFESSDAALEAMNSQFISNCQITISYAYKNGSIGEKHCTLSAYSEALICKSLEAMKKISNMHEMATT